MSNKRKLRELDDVVVEMLASNPKDIDKYLKIALEDYEESGDEASLLIALRQVTLAKGGFAELSKKTGLTRNSLYKTLSAMGNPKIKTLKTILNALGYTFKFQHI